MKKNLIAGKSYLAIAIMAGAVLSFAGCSKAESLQGAVSSAMPKPDEVDAAVLNFELSKAYEIVRAGTLKAENYVKNIENMPEACVGFLSFTKRGNLTVMTDEMLEQKAVLGDREMVFGKELEFVETVEVEEEGIYDAQIGVMDPNGNIRMAGCTFYVDGTAPEITGLTSQEISVENPAQEFEIHMDDLQIYDSFDGDLMAAERYVQTIVPNEDGQWTKKGFSETFTVTVTATDRAGNTSECSAQVLASWDSTKAVEELFAAKQKNEAALAVQEISDGFDRAKAEEAFSLVNEQRVSNGLSALEWNENLYELTCTRVQEIAEKFAHERPDGTLVTAALRSLGYTAGTGENISRYGTTASQTVDSWMNSPSHRDNILTSYYVQGCMACYCCGGKYYWVNLFNG